MDNVNSITICDTTADIFNLMTESGWFPKETKSREFWQYSITENRWAEAWRCFIQVETKKDGDQGLRMWIRVTTLYLFPNLSCVYTKICWQKSATTTPTTNSFVWYCKHGVVKLSELIDVVPLWTSHTQTIF